MTRETFEQRLGLLSPRQESKIVALVDEYRRDVAEVQSVAIRATQLAGDGARRAVSLIAQLGEIAVESLVSAVSAQKNAPETSLLIAMVQGVIFAETMVVGRLKAALTDARMIPELPEMRVHEDASPPHRVCDEAYITLRRLLRAESYLRHLLEARHFLSLPEASRNLEISSWLETKSFTRFLGDFDEEE